MVPTFSSSATRRIDTAGKPSRSAMASAAVAILCRLRRVFGLDIRTLYQYSIRTVYDTTVLIAGAGPTGLTLALDLARRSIPFRLIEAAAKPFQGSRGKGLQPRTLE